MRKTITYDKTKEGTREYIKMKPHTDIKGVVTLQLCNCDTGEIEREIKTENVRMKWLDSQIYIDGISTVCGLWDLAIANAGYVTSSGKTNTRLGHLTNLLLLNSEGEENEKIPSTNGALIGICELDKVYSGQDTQKGTFNKTESYIKQNEEGNLVMHNVYDFPTHACNGTITHLGYTKHDTKTIARDSYTIFGKYWNCTEGIPTKIFGDYNPTSAMCSCNCFMTGKNTFLFSIKVQGSWELWEMNIVTGQLIRKSTILGADGNKFNQPYMTSMILSKDGTTLYMIGKADHSSQLPNWGASEIGICVMSIDTSNGKHIETKSFGALTPQNNSKEFGEYTVGTIDIYGNGNLILFGGPTSNLSNYLTEININDGSIVKEYVLDYSDSDSVSNSEIYRGVLYTTPQSRIIYRRCSAASNNRNHLVFDRQLNLIERNSNVRDTATILMQIINNEHLAIGTVDNRTTNYQSWGIFDKRNKYPMSTLTKLPSPVVKTANFTMKVQYDLIFEIPNVIEAFTQV